MKNHYTEPKLAKFPLETGKRWYVWFRFNGGNPIRIYTGLNQILSYNERLYEGNLMCRVIAAKLKSGWVPDKSKDILTKKNIITAFDEAIERIRENVSKNTFTAYSSAKNAFAEAIHAKKFNRMLAANFSRAHAKQCLEWLRNDRGWSNHSYNKNLGYIRSVFHEIIEAEQAQVNPFREIKNLKITKTTPANIPPTDEQMIMICDELKAKNYGFYVFYMLIYYCGLRPDECRNLQIKNIDFKNKLLHLKGTKTGDRTVPLLGNTYDLLISCKDHPKDFYVFGTWVNNGGRHSRKNWFSPNPYRLKEDTPNREWKRLIKDGLNLDLSLYSGKHKGADDKLEAGMDLQTICDIFGHSETKMTERYARRAKLDRFEKAKDVKMKEF